MKRYQITMPLAGVEVIEVGEEDEDDDSEDESED